jgi:uncharacterized protein YndB with AHSA1/START domain
MTSVGSSEAIDLKVRIAAKPETVFPFLTDAAKVPLWFGAEADVEARQGGIYKVKINPQATALGEVVEVQANKRIVFTFGWEGQDPHNGVAPGSSRVEISLTPDGDGTLVRLVHTGLPEPATKDHRSGWGLYLNRLQAVAGGRDPGKDPNAG